MLCAPWVGWLQRCPANECQAFYLYSEMGSQMGEGDRGGETASRRSPNGIALAHSSDIKDSDFSKDKRVSKHPVRMASRLKKDFSLVLLFSHQREDALSFKNLPQRPKYIYMILSDYDWLIA